LNFIIDDRCGEITDKVLSDLGDGVKTLQNLQSISLDFSSLQINDEGMKELSKLLTQLKSLKTLNLKLAEYIEK